MHNQDEEVNAGVFTNPAIPPQYRGLFVTPAAPVELFPTTAVSPWISLGGGFGHIGEPKNLLTAASIRARGRPSACSKVDWAGIVRVWKRLSIRGERRDFWSGEPDFPLAPTGKARQPNYFVGDGAFCRFWTNHADLRDT